MNEIFLVMWYSPYYVELYTCIKMCIGLNILSSRSNHGSQCRIFLK